MGVRKRQAADAIKEARKSEYFALHNAVVAPQNASGGRYDPRSGGFKALGILQFSNKEASRKVEKLLRSAIANWEQKTSARQRPASST